MRIGQILGQILKKRFFFDNITISNLEVLEIGSGSNWTKTFITEKNATYRSLDIMPPADIVCDIKDYKNSVISDQSFDIIIAFEVVEHVDCLNEIASLLKCGGLALVTTPVPHFDWLCKLLEFFHINQKRTSPHSNLIYLKEDLPKSLCLKKYRNPFLFAQWAVLEKS